MVVCVCVLEVCAARDSPSTNTVRQRLHDISSAEKWTSRDHDLSKTWGRRSALTNLELVRPDHAVFVLVWVWWCCVVCCVLCVVVLVCVVWHAEKFPCVDLKRPPCVHSKRPRVYRHHVHMCFNMCAWCRHTRRCFECTHGSRFERTRGPSSSLPFPTHTHATHTQKKDKKRKRKRRTHTCVSSTVFRNNHNNTTQLNTEHATQKQRKEKKRDRYEERQR